MSNRPSATAKAFALLCFFALGGISSAASQSTVPMPAVTDAGATLWVSTTQRIKSKIYEGSGLSQHPILVIVVHGDGSDGSPSTYHYRFAKNIAAEIPDTVVAAVLRPGYSDGDDTSDGLRGFTTGDNWTPEIVNAVGSVLSELKGRYHPRRAILVGHSGGAAIVGSLLGQAGVAVDGALLVSCPCDVAAWRKHMQSVKGGSIWERPVRSLSPLDLTNRIPASTKIALLVGSDDQTTPTDLTFAYAEALSNRSIKVTTRVAPGLGHNILLEPIAVQQLKELSASVDTQP